MPHLTGDEQLKVMEKVHTSAILLTLADSLKPADPLYVEDVLERAFAEGDPQKVGRLLGAVKHARYVLTDRSKEIVGEALASPDKSVRTQALGIAADLEDLKLLRLVVDSGWDSSALTSEESFFEIWYGSAVLLAAADAGLVGVADALDRMAYSHYGYAAKRLGLKGVRAIADRITVALGKVLRLSDISDLPEMERRSPAGPSSAPPRVDLRDETTPKDMKAAFDRMGETDQQFQDRQQRLYKAYSRFSRELTNADAQLVLTDLTFDGLAAIVDMESDITTAWYGMLVNADVQKKRSLHLFAVQFASAIARTTPDRAVTVFQAYAAIDPTVRHVIGSSKIPADAWAMWSRADVAELHPLCLERLDDATTDAELSTEVLAAFRTKHEAILSAYVGGLIATGEPASVARAITIAGFSDKAPFADEVLERFESAKGFIGSAYQAAKFAYDRNVWARHWFDEMRNAATPVDFWRYSVLLAKVVDARFELWSPTNGPGGPIAARFYSTIEAEIRQCIKNWSDKRRNKLFGENAPSPIFLSR